MKLNRKQRRALKVKGVKMSVRTEDEIRKEYLDLCGRAGEVQYQIQQLSAALNGINSRLVEVNKEFVDLKEAEGKKGEENAKTEQADQASANP